MSLTLDGNSLASFGLILQPRKDIEILPVTRDRTVQIPKRDGAYDFGADLAERRFGLPLAWAKETSESNLAAKIQTFADFLVDANGKPRDIKLVFDFETTKYFTVRYSGQMLPSRQLSMAFFMLPMTAFDPAKYATIAAFDENNEYDTGLQYDSGLIYDNPESFSWLYESHMSGVYNWSKKTTPLILTIVGTVTNPSITNADTGETITITTALSGQTLVIDGKKMQVTIDGVNNLNLMSGDFVNLQQGSNGLTFSGTDPDATVTYSWLHKFV